MADSECMAESVLSRVPIEEARFAERLRSGHSILFKPHGSSMEPALSDGTIVMVDPLSRPPTTGEVVLAYDPLARRYVLHRVTTVRGNRLWLWGDNVRRSDGWFALDDIVGIARLPKAVGWHASRLALRRALYSVVNLVVR